MSHFEERCISKTVLVYGELYRGNQITRNVGLIIVERSDKISRSVITALIIVTSWWDSYFPADDISQYLTDFTISIWKFNVLFIRSVFWQTISIAQHVNPSTSFSAFLPSLSFVWVPLLLKRSSLLLISWQSSFLKDFIMLFLIITVFAAQRRDIFFPGKDW